MIIVSACLAGVRCRYDGNSNQIDKIRDLVDSGKAILVCPEVLGGMPTPRTPCEIVKSKGGTRTIQTKDGLDYTVNFKQGAEKTLEIAKIVEAKQAILKANSPSCGFGFIYDGTFSGNRCEGNGFTAEILNESGIKIYNEVNWNL